MIIPNKEKGINNTLLEELNSPLILDKYKTFNFRKFKQTCEKNRLKRKKKK